MSDFNPGDFDFTELESQKDEIEEFVNSYKQTHVWTFVDAKKTIDFAKQGKTIHGRNFIKHDLFWAPIICKDTSSENDVVGVCVCLLNDKSINCKFELEIKGGKKITDDEMITFNYGECRGYEIPFHVLESSIVKDTLTIFITLKI